MILSREFLNRLWYGDHPAARLLAPLGWIYAGVVALRKLAYDAGVIPVRSVPVPVIVVGNVTVGGTGKTPLIIWLAEFLRDQGHQVGIISRGYKGGAHIWPQQVRPDTSCDLVGDEPVLIAQRTLCPVAVGPQRDVAARELVKHNACTLLLCDDGLQHYALHRDIEIAVIDGDRRFGNGRCLPAGPLREPAARLKSVDMVVSNSKAGRSEFLMEYYPLPLRALKDDSLRMDIDALRGHDVHAVAGIGNPARFYSCLRSHELHIIKHEFPDHHAYTAADFDFDDERPIIMTEKDAVKCRRYAGDNFWYLPVEARLPAAFGHRLNILLKEALDGQKAA